MLNLVSVVALEMSAMIFSHTKLWWDWLHSKGGDSQIISRRCLLSYIACFSKVFIFVNDLWRFWWPSSTSLQQDTLKKFTETIIVCICQALGEILCYLLFNFILSTALLNGFFFSTHSTHRIYNMSIRKQSIVLFCICVLGSYHQDLPLHRSFH